MHPGVPAGGHGRDIQSTTLKQVTLWSTVEVGGWSSLPFEVSTDRTRCWHDPLPRKGGDTPRSSLQPERQKKDQGETGWSLPGTQESPVPGLFVNVSRLLKGKSLSGEEGALVLLRMGGSVTGKCVAAESCCYVSDCANTEFGDQQGGG